MLDRPPKSRRPLPGSRTALEGTEVEQFPLTCEADELWELLVNRLPEAFAAALNRIKHADEADFAEDYDQAVQQIIDASALLENVGDDESKRVICPLCGGGSPYDANGFKYPAGLWKHLVGDQNSRECVMMSSARRQGIHRIDVRKKMFSRPTSKTHKLRK